MGISKGGEADQCIYDQLAAAALELEQLVPGAASARLLNAQRLLRRAKMVPPKSRESHP